MTSLTGSVTLITGGSGRIGSATAKSCIERGGSVMLHDINKTSLIELTNEFNKEYPGKASYICSDITDEQEIESLFSKTFSHFGLISSVIHAAYPVSDGWGSSLDELQAKYLYQDINNQLGTSILISKHSMQAFQSQGFGNLIHISSIHGVQTAKFEHYDGLSMSSPIEYAAIKSGIISITKWLAKKYTNKNIRVNCVSPGGIRDAQPKTFEQRYRASCTNIGLLSPTNVSDVIVFLISDQATAINGQNIIVDDGWSL